MYRTTRLGKKNHHGPSLRRLPFPACKLFLDSEHWSLRSLGPCSKCVIPGRNPAAVRRIECVASELWLGTWPARCSPRRPPQPPRAWPHPHAPPQRSRGLPCPGECEGTSCRIGRWQPDQYVYRRQSCEGSKIRGAAGVVIRQSHALYVAACKRTHACMHALKHARTNARTRTHMHTHTCSLLTVL